MMKPIAIKGRTDNNNQGNKDEGKKEEQRGGQRAAKGEKKKLYAKQPLLTRQSQVGCQVAYVVG